MKRKEEREVPARKEMQVAEVRCDICGRTGKAQYLPWATGTYDATESTVRLKTGDSYPDGGHGVEVEIDVCPTCFKEKLVPWVESFGHAKIRETDWDY